MHNIEGVKDVCLSLPTVIRENGVCEILSVDLNEEETKLFHRSAEKIHQEIEKSLLFIE